MLYEKEVEQLVREQLRLPKKQEVEVCSSTLFGCVFKHSNELFYPTKSRAYTLERHVVIIKKYNKNFHVKLEYPVDCCNTGLYLPVEEYNSYNMFDVVGVTSDSANIDIPRTIEEEIDRYCDGGVMRIQPHYASIWKRILFLFDNRSKEKLAEVVGDELVILYGELKKYDLAMILK